MSANERDSTSCLVRYKIDGPPPMPIHIFHLCTSPYVCSSAITYVRVSCLCSKMHSNSASHPIFCSHILHWQSKTQYNTTTLNSYVSPQLLNSSSQDTTYEKRNRVKQSLLVYHDFRRHFSFSLTAMSASLFSSRFAIAQNYRISIFIKSWPPSH